MSMKFCPKCATELSKEILGGVERDVCTQPDCGFVFWDNPVPVVAAIVEYNHDIVLARNSQWPQGVFSMITGYLERNETPESAVLREVKEELGLEGRLTTFIGHYPFPRKNQLILAYAVRATGKIQLDHEIAEVKLVARDGLDVKQFAKLQLTAKIFRDWLSE